MKRFWIFVVVFFAFSTAISLNQKISAQVYFSESFYGIWDYGTALCDATTEEITSTQLGSNLGNYGWSGNKIFPAWGKLKLGSGSTKGWLQTPAIDCSADSGNFVIRFDAKAWNSASEQSSLKVFVNGTLAYIAEDLPKADCDLRTYIAYVSGGTTSTRIRFEGMEDERSRFYIDNISVESIGAQPDIIIDGITDFRQFPLDRPMSHQLNITGHNLTPGDSTTVSVTGSVFGCTHSKLSNDDMMSEDGVNIVISFIGNSTGTYESTLTLRNNDATRTATLTASCFNYTPISTIAQLRTLYNWSNIDESTTGSVIYKYVGEAVVTAMDPFQGKKVIQDSTGAIFIFDNGNRILADVHPGDKITGVYGLLANYHGYLEFKMQADIDGIISSYNDVTPLPVTLAQLNDKTFMDAHQAELITLRNSAFSSSGIFTTGDDPDNDAQRLYVRQGNNSDVAVYTLFRNADYIGDTIPRGNINITGFNYFTAALIPNTDNIRYDARYYIVPTYFTEYDNSFEATACGSYTWNDSTYTESGDYVQNFVGIDGIDSSVTLHLTIINREEINIDTLICQHETLYYEDFEISTENMLIGNNIDTIADTNNCRVFYLNVTIRPKYTINLQDTVVVGQSYTENGFNISAQQTSVVGSVASVLFLQTADGCDSTIILALEVIEQLDTTGIYQYNIGQNIQLYPNPAQNITTITTTDDMGIQQIDCYDITGKIIAQYTPSTPNYQNINTENWNAGVYFIKITTNQGVTTKKLIIK